eukprot:2937154-Pyramimonas_sp.AAC.1
MNGHLPRANARLGCRRHDFISTRVKKKRRVLRNNPETRSFDPCRRNACNALSRANESGATAPL